MGFFKDIFKRGADKAKPGFTPYRADVSTLIVKLHTDIMSAEWNEDYAPPELQNADKTTVLSGFRKDAMRELLDPIKEKMRVAKHNLDDFTRADMASELKRIAGSQPGASYGYFIKTIANEFLKNNLPEYAETPKPPSSTSNKLTR